MFEETVHNILKQKNKRFALCVSILMLAFVAGRMVLTRLYMDNTVHYYTEKANIFVMSFDYIIAACVIIIYLISFFIYKRKKENHNYIETADYFVQGTQPEVFSASLTGFLFIAASVFQVYSYISSLNKADGFINQIKSYMSNLPGYIKTSPLDFAIFFISVLSAVYFFKTAAINFDIGENIGAVTEKENSGTEKEKPESAGYKYSSAHIIFSFMPIIWSFLNIFKCFFDMSKNVNSPVRVYELMGFLFLSAYFVSESRMLVGRKETSRFFTFAYISLIVLTASSLPNLIWSSFWILTTNSDQIVYAVQLAIAIYIFSRVYSQIKYGRFMLQR